MSRVFDCFMFYNELDLLEMRLNELKDVVDFFILVEATKTHSGQDKPLHYWENRNRFKKFHYMLYDIVVQDMPMTNRELRNATSSRDMTWIESGYQVEDSWVRERFQRNAIMRAFEPMDGDVVYPDDIIIIEDADEMVRPEVLATIRDTLVSGSNAVEQTLHTYYMNWKCTNMSWSGSKIIRYKDMAGLMPSEIRFHTPASEVILNGGWHFGYLGGVPAIQDKIKSFAHQEFNTNTVLDNVEHLLHERKDGIGRQYQYEVVPIDDTYPKYVRDNPNKFEKYMDRR